MGPALYHLSVNSPAELRPTSEPQPKSTGIESKTRSSGLHQNQKHLCVRGHFQESEQKLTEWDKILAHHPPNRDEPPEHIKNSYQSVTTKNKEDIAAANNPLGKMFNIKTTVRYHCILIQMAVTENTHTQRTQQVLVKTWGNGNLCALLAGM